LVMSTRRAGAACLFLFALAISGCQRGSSAGSTSVEPATVSIGIAAPEGGGDPGLRIVADFLTVESLVTLNHDGREVPNLASKWVRSSDGLSWRFELRDGVRFHDGTPLTAQSVADNLKSVTGPGAGAQAPSFQQVTSVGVDGPSAVILTLARPSALLLSDLAYVNITTTSGSQVVGTGPFAVQSKDDKRIVLRRFDKYREGASALDHVELNAFPTVRNAWTALMRGEVDFLYEVGADAAEFVDGESSVQTFSFMRPYTMTLGFNLNHPVLRSREVRRALNRAVDRDEIVRAVYRGRGRQAQDPVWPYHWASDKTTPQYTYNREAAILGFAAAGYGGIRADGNRMPNRFKFHCLVLPQLERSALIVQKQLYGLGVDMTVELTPLQILGQRLARGDYDAYLLWQTTGRSLSWPYLFWHSPESSRPSFVRTAYSVADQALDRIRFASNDEEFRKGVAAFQQVIHDDPPAVFLAWEERMRAVSRKFHVPPLEPGRDVVASLWRWRPAAPASARAQ
jgi:peptide/nickel transport system substrate-binding protein